MKGEIGVTKAPGARVDRRYRGGAEAQMLVWRYGKGEAASPISGRVERGSGATFRRYRAEARGRGPSPGRRRPSLAAGEHRQEGASLGLGLGRPLPGLQRNRAATGRALTPRPSRGTARRPATLHRTSTALVGGFEPARRPGVKQAARAKRRRRAGAPTSAPGGTGRCTRRRRPRRRGPGSRRR